MLYGCVRGVVKKYNFLMTSAKIRFFWIPLSRVKCSSVPFTHICEWETRSPSSGSYGSFDWIVVVMAVVVGSTSMIYLPLLFFESMSNLGLDSISLSSATNDCFKGHSSVLCQGILWKLRHFPMSFIVFTFLLFSCRLDWLS
jgi:hypothetical protein